ncbi:ATP-binding protein [Celeribacter sp.]|uniref:sensor histidine kinase n=1 Tax=Celeribacter sp. TaxID=1890673 RepID=UPI003A8D7D5A
MKRLSGSGLRLILPLIAILVFAVLLGFALLRMVKVETDIRMNAEQNMLWVMHQSESAARRLIETTMRAELGEGDTEEIALRLDLLRSRFALLQSGPQQRFMSEIGLSDQLSELHTILETIQPLPEDFTIADAKAFRQKLAPFPTFFSRAANTTMIREWDDLGGRLETSREQLRQIIISLIGITVTGAVLVVSLFLALRLSHQRNSMLRRARDFSEILISSSGEGILAVDDTGVCTIWNPAMAAMTNRPAEHAVGRKLSDIVEFFNIAPVRQAIQASLKGKTTTLALQPYFPDVHAPPLHVDLKISPMRDGKDVLGAIVFMHDASDRHAAQQKDAETRERLEHLVAERTRELDNALTRERSAADLYRNFAGMISHQFRTPLAVADSALQRLIRRGKRANAEEVSERAARARDAIAGLTRLVESTLDTARLQAEQVGAQRVLCNLSEVVEMVRARQQATAPNTPLEVQQEPNFDPVALCDPAHAEQVLENLLSNAVKYSAKGATVTISLHHDAAQVYCDISNFGPAIEPEDRAHLFHANFRGINSTGTSGTGLGLFIARSLARMQGGEVNLLQEDEAKVTFRFSLPRIQGEHHD